MGDDYKKILNDYPTLKQFCTDYEEGYIFPTAEALNEHMGEGRFKMGELFTAEILNEWLDVLERKGLLVEDQKRLEETP
jgi:hypothetical protein